MEFLNKRLCYKNMHLHEEVKAGLEKQKERERVLSPNVASLENFKQKSFPLQSGGVFHVSAHVELFYAFAINLRQRGCRGKAGPTLTMAVPP